MVNKILQFTIYTKEDFSDKSLLEFMLHNKDISIGSYSRFLSKTKLNNAFAEKVIRFICNYDNGFLKPDKCDAHEPIREIFNEQNLNNPIRWLSQPGGAFYFKKIKGFKIEGVIENCRFAPIWDEGKLLEPVVTESIYKGEVRLFFDEKVIKIKGVQYWTNLIKDIYDVANASLGLLTTTDEIHNYDIKQIRGDKIIVGHNAKSIFSQLTLD
jgi:hypothetical protein